MTNWPKEYLKAIQSGEEVVSKKVRAVYERECAWMDSPPDDFSFYFDEKRAENHIKFIETFCKHSKGKSARKPIKLELFQKAKLSLVFGWVDKLTGFRRFHEVVDIRGRKCGKSTETSGVAWDVFLNDHENGPEVYCVANKLDQAKLIFDECVNMRTQSPALKAITNKRQSDIYCPSNMGIIKCLASDTKTMDGLNPSFFVQDEIHAAKNSDLYDVMVQGQSIREQPLAWLIGTNGFVRDGFYDEKYAYASKVALWEPGFEDYRMLPLIYELDNRDNWDKPEHWAEANPGLGKIKRIDKLRENVEKAKRDPLFLRTLLTKDFNVPVTSNSAWLSYEAIVNETVADMNYLEHSYCIGGCDLSSTTDLTCASVIIMKPNDDNIYLLQKYFMPRGRLEALEKTKSREAPYRLWADKGWLHICDGAMVNYHDVTEWFVNLVNDHDIRPLYIGYDRAMANYWRDEMESYGFDMEAIPQGPITWSYPMKQFGAMFEDHKVIYQNSPMFRWCLMNTAVKTLNKDGIQTIQPVKLQYNMRIDGFVSALNAYTCMMNHADEFMNYLR